MDEQMRLRCLELAVDIYGKVQVDLDANEILKMALAFSGWVGEGKLPLSKESQTSQESYEALVRDGKISR